MTVDALFINFTNPKASRKEKEIQRHKARSHAAKISHQRRRSSLGDDVIPTPTDDGRVDREAETPLTDNNSLDSPGGSENGTYTGVLRAWRGNGDPFDVVGVLPITPRVVDILVFIKDYYVRAPLAVKPHTTSLIAPKVENQVEESFETSIVAMQQHSCAPAYLYSIITAMSLLSTDPELHLEQLKTKQQTFMALRDRIMQHSDQVETVRQVTEYLFGAAVMAYDLREASIHAKALRDMLLNQIAREGTESLNTSILARYLYKDALLAEHFMSKPIFEIETWQPVLIDRFVHRGLLPPRSSDNESPLDVFVIESGLEPIFHYARQGLPAFSRPGFVHGPDRINPWAYCAIILLQCRANAIFAALYPRVSVDHDYAQSPRSDQGYDAEDLISLVTAALCAASLLFSYLFRLKADQMFHPGPPPTLLRLQAIVERIAYLRKSTSAKDLLYVETSLIWICFIGSIAEQLTATRWAPVPRMSVFDSCSQAAAYHLGIDPTSWPEIEEVLAGFVYSPRLIPQDT